MNSNARTAPRLPALAFAAVMTLATLVGVGQLADQAHVQLAQAAAQSVAV